jgi:hypothetical protein
MSVQRYPPASDLIGHRAGPLWSAQLERSVEDDQQLFVRVVGVIGHGLAARVDLIERAAQIAGAGRRSQA